MKVPDDLDGSRLDRAVASMFDLGTNTARRLIEAGRLGKRKKGDVVKAGDDIALAGGGDWFVPGGTVAVLFEDDGVLVVDKPAGMPCHPLVPGEGGTVVDALVAKYPEIATASDDAREAGLVHRLDTGTSGCLAVARSRASWLELRDAWDAVEKRYRAVVEGTLARSLELRDPIAHDPQDARRMIIGKGRDAWTSITVVERRPTTTLVEALLRGPGRRHQIRVHLANAGFPLVGDALYGAATDAWPVLHAARLVLPGRPPVDAIRAM